MSKRRGVSVVKTTEENMLRFMIIIMITTIVSLTSGCKKEEKITLETADVVESQGNESDDEQEEFIYVHVSGAVNSEGVYQLKKGSRAFEAIQLAGGFREDAYLSGINQAKVLEDEEKIHIPTIEEHESQETAGTGKININTASKEKLMSLPGVGESRAEDIIKFREKQGGFKKLEDIMQIQGIKEGLFEKIKDLITI